MSLRDEIKEKNFDTGIGYYASDDLKNSNYIYFSEDARLLEPGTYQINRGAGYPIILYPDEGENDESRLNLNGETAAYIDLIPYGQEATNPSQSVRFEFFKAPETKRDSYAITVYKDGKKRRYPEEGVFYMDSFKKDFESFAYGVGNRNILIKDGEAYFTEKNETPSPVIDFDTEIFHGMENIPQSPEGLNFDVKWGTDFRLQDANGQQVRANRQVNEETGQVSYVYTMSSNSKHKIEFGGDWVTGAVRLAGAFDKDWQKETVTGIDLDDPTAYCKMTNEENGQQIEIREDPDSHAMNIATITDIDGKTAQIRIPNSKMGDAITYLQNAVYNNTMEIKDGKLTFKAKEDIAKERADQEYSKLLSARNADIAQLKAAANAPISLPNGMSDKEVARLLSESPVQGDTYLTIDEKGQYLPGSTSSPIATTGCMMKDGNIVAKSENGGEIQVRGMGTYKVDSVGNITDKEGNPVELETLKTGAQNYNKALAYTKELNERDIAQKKLNLYKKAEEQGRPKDAIEILDASPEQLHAISEKEKILEGVTPKQYLDQRMALVQSYMESGLSLEQAEARFNREFGDLNDENNHAGKRKLALTIPAVNDQIKKAALEESAEEKFSKGAEKGDFSGLFGEFGQMFEAILKLIQTFLGGGNEASPQSQNAWEAASTVAAPTGGNGVNPGAPGSTPADPANTGGEVTPDPTAAPAAPAVAPGAPAVAPGAPTTPNNPTAAPIGLYKDYVD